MADIFRGPLIFRNWQRDPNQVAVNSQHYTLSARTVPTETPYDLGFNLWGLPERQRINPQDWVQGTPLALLATPAVTQNPFFQTDWPVPRGRLPPPLGWTDSFKLPLQQFLPPGLQRNWPNPVLRIVQRQDWVEGAPLTLLAPNDPAAAADWSNPPGPARGNQDWVQGTPLTLLAPAAPLPRNQSNWPNPILRVQRQDWVEGTPLTLTSPAVTANPGFDLWGSPNWRPYQRQDWILPSNIALLTGTAQNPFFQTDWPVPRGPQRLPQDWEDWFKLPLQQTLPPGLQRDWPNPVLRIVQRQDWIAPSPIALQTAVQAPFYQTAWPNPVLRTVQRPDWTDAFKLPLQQNLPPTQKDFPNPILPVVRRQDWRDSFKLPLQSTLPENQYDWPLPSRGPKRNPQDWVEGTPLTLATAVALVTNPGFNVWGVPGPRPFKLQDWIQSSNIALLAPTAQNPFFQTDWPNPRGPRPVPQGWTDSFKLPLQQVLPPTQKDWPNPVRRKPPAVFDWIQATSQALSFVQAPFRQTDWPNPVRAKGRLLPTWTDAFKLPLQQVLPPRQTDWPVPKGPRWPVVTDIGFIMPTRPSPPIPPVYDADNTLKNERLRLRDLSNKNVRVRFLKNEIRR